MSPELMTDDQLNTVQFLTGQLVDHQPGCQQQAYECSVPDDSVSVRLMTSFDISEKEAGFAASVELNLEGSDLDSLFLSFGGNNELGDLAPAFESAEAVDKYVQACDELLSSASLDEPTAVVVSYLKDVLKALISDIEDDGSRRFGVIPRPIIAADGNKVHPAQAIRQASRARLGNGHWLMRELEPELTNGSQLAITKHEPRDMPLSEDPEQPLLQIYYDDQVGNISYVWTTDQFGQISLEVTAIGGLIKSNVSAATAEPANDENSATELIVQDFMSEFTDTDDRPLADDVQVLIDVMTAVVITESGFGL